MDQPLKVLILEDADYDVELIEYELNKLKTPVSTRRVATRESPLPAGVGGVSAGSDPGGLPAAWV